MDEDEGHSPHSSTRPERAEARSFLKRWTSLDDNGQTEVPPFNDVDFSCEELQHPLEYFRTILDEDIMNEIVFQTNLYSIQKDTNKPCNLTANELEQWVGLVLYFSISKLPNIRMHWCRLMGPLSEVASGIMSRNRFETIKSNIHLSDNTVLETNPEKKQDKMFKVRILIEHLQKKFRDIPKGQNLSADEQMVPFKGKSQLRQYVPNKPKKWGYKFFVLAGSDGMMHDFFPYTGKIEPVADSNVPDLKASSNAVLHLAQTIPARQNHVLFFDNWFTSLGLIDHLASREIWSCGTIRTARLQGLSKDKQSDKELMKKPRGSHEEYGTQMDNCNLTYVKWRDNKTVNLVSSFARANPVAEVRRFDKSTKRYIDIPRPDIVGRYNKSMGGVDLADQLLSLYRINIRSKKYYHRLIYHMIDMTVVNAWLLYKRDATKLNTAKKDIYALAEFKILIAFGLMKSGKLVSSVKKGRPSSSPSVQEKKRRCQVPDSSIRFDNIDHWPIIVEKRNRCKIEKCSGKTVVMCEKCNVNLCLNNSNNCFKDYHKRK